MTTSADHFGHWYESFDGVNKTVPRVLPLSRSVNGVSLLDQSFFPLGERGGASQASVTTRNNTPRILSFIYRDPTTFPLRRRRDVHVQRRDDVWNLHQCQAGRRSRRTPRNIHGSVLPRSAAATLGSRGGNRTASISSRRRHSQNFRLPHRYELRFLNCGLRRPIVGMECRRKGPPKSL